MRKVLIIGAGIVGCSVARELSRYGAEITVLEKFNDVSCGTTKANSGIVHAGFDAKPNTKKAKFNLLGNAMFDKLAKELDFPFKRNGALVLCFSEEDLPNLYDLYQRGVANGVEELQTLTGEQVREIEPHVSKEVVAALWAKTSGIVSPYEMAIAYAENAAANGVKFLFEKKVTKIAKKGKIWQVETQDGAVYEADMVINCAGVHADDLNNMVSDKKIEIIPRKGEYMLYDKT